MQVQNLLHEFGWIINSHRRVAGLQNRSVHKIEIILGK